MTGEQSPTPEEVTHSAEIDALRAEAERLKQLTKRDGQADADFADLQRAMEDLLEAGNWMTTRGPEHRMLQHGRAIGAANVLMRAIRARGSR